jgi:hypothetical protein
VEATAGGVFVDDYDVVAVDHARAVRGELAELE